MGPPKIDFWFYYTAKIKPVNEFWKRRRKKMKKVYYLQKIDRIKTSMQKMKKVIDGWEKDRKVDL